MTVLVTPDEMRAAERAAVAAGRPEPDLMRAAAEQIAGWLERAVPNSDSGPGQRRHAVAIVGPGNNGGDALVALALLSYSWRVSAIYVGRTERGVLPAASDSLDRIERATPDALDDATIILDGVYGIGSRAALPAEVEAVFERAHLARRERGVPLIAIDVPSGVDARTGAANPNAFTADVTLCLGLPKVGLVREPAASHTGELVMFDIGIEPLPQFDTSGRPRLITRSIARSLVPRRQASAHKTQTGTVLAVAGAPTYYGAPRLCAEAALRAGAGLVALAAPASLVPVIAGAVPEIVMLPLSEHNVEASIKTLDAFATQRASTLRASIVGPGLGAGEAINRLLETLLGATDAPDSLRHLATLPLVIDADGLNWIARRGGWPEKVRLGAAVLTPHAGELARLMRVDVDDVVERPWELARSAARESGQYVVLKLGHTAVASPGGELWIAPRSMPELATAGTGDVLAGLIGGFLAQGVEPWDAARLAVYLGAETGRRERYRRGTLSVIARDVIDGLPVVLRDLTEPSFTADNLPSGT